MTEEKEEGVTRRRDKREEPSALGKRPCKEKRIPSQSSHLVGDFGRRPQIRRKTKILPVSAGGRDSRVRLKGLRPTKERKKARETEQAAKAYKKQK